MSIIRRSFIAILFLSVAASHAKAQLTWSPILASSEDSLTIIYDGKGGNGDLADFTGDVYIHTGVITSQSTSEKDWKYVKPGPWTSFPDSVKATYLGDSRWSYTYRPTVREFFGVPAGEEIQKLAVLFRGVVNGSITNVGRDVGGADLFIELNQGGVILQRILPQSDQIICTIPCSVEVVAVAASNTNSTIQLTLFENGSELATIQDDTLRTTVEPINFGLYEYQIIAQQGQSQTDTSSFSVLLSRPVPTAPRPAGLQDGITIEENGTIYLSLFAPYKNQVHVLGEFNDWQPSNEYLMNKDSHNQDSTWFWIALEDLPSEGEIAFQYLVDQDIRIADPYSTLILDPFDDQFIPESIYPDLKAYPDGKTQFQVGVLELGRQPYNWQHSDYERPKKDELIIYELLLRDFLETHNFSTLIDTLDYLENLGINAIELMPVNEFEGNNSWGYNPSFYFAVDKYYGKAEDLKRFVDEAHSRGIAVILDMVLNHSFGQSPLVRLYSTGDYGPPTANNPWFNTESKHDFNVGYDMNHESAATQYFVDRVTTFWIEEYKIDGFRFDLSKGFTQNNTLGDIGAWGRYDVDRVRLLKRMADRIWDLDPETYIILEHFAEDREERALSNHGMLLWRNVNHAYNQATMGYSEGSDFSAVSHSAAGWTKMHAVAYMESHDEQWMMFRNVNYGNVAGDYSVKDFRTALKRQQMVGAFFFLWPGPKMIWQFGELGYGGSSGECLRGNSDNECKPSDPSRTGEKPIRWNYKDNTNRYRIYQTWSALLDLRYAHPAFTSEDTDITKFLSSDQKYIYMDHPELKALIMGNFGVEPKSRTFSMSNFNSETTWYDYFTGAEITTDSEGKLYFDQQPGEFMILTTQKFPTPEQGIITSNHAFDEQSTLPKDFKIHSIYPNPFNPSSIIEYHIAKPGAVTLRVMDILGREVGVLRQNEQLTPGSYKAEFDGAHLSSGLYFVQLISSQGIHSQAVTLLK